MSKPGLWANIHAKRKRIKAGSGERMRKPGEEGAPTPEALKKSQKKVSEEAAVMPAAANAVATGAVDMNPNGGKTRMKKKPLKRFKTYMSSLETDGIH